MFICYYINPNTNTVSLQYSQNKECELILEFQQDDAIPSFELIEVTTDENDYDTEAAYRDLAKHLWDELADIPTDEDGADGTIESDFLHFEAGENVYTIWHWFEAEFDVSIAEDLMGIE